MTVSLPSITAFIGNAAATASSNYLSRSGPLIPSSQLVASRVLATTPSVLATTAPGSSTALHLFRTAITLADQTGPAISYFTSIRVPAALIAGSSLASLFTLVDKTLDGQRRRRSHIETAVLVIYHILALSSLLLSLNVIVTATASANAILLRCDNPMATSTFALLTRECRYEFLLTRWSFFSGLFCFLGVVAARALVEFELMRRSRLRSATLVVSAVLTLFFHLLSFVNSRLYCYDNLGTMTVALFGMWVQRSVSGRSPSELASLMCFGVSVGAAVSVMERTRLFSRRTVLDPDEAEMDNAYNDADKDGSETVVAVRNVIDESCDGDDAYQDM